jgi:hypothetical protein
VTLPGDSVYSSRSERDVKSSPAPIPHALADSKVGLVCDDPTTAEIILRGVKGLVEVRKIEARSSERGEGLDALIVVFEDPPEVSIRFVLRCLDANPQLQLIGVSEFDTNHVVELMKCGLTDHLSPPVDALLLQRKLERATLRLAGTVLDSPAFAALPRARSGIDRPNKRTCARARITSELPASVMLTVGSASVRVQVVDIAVVTEGHPGGLGLLIPPDIHEQLGLSNDDPHKLVPIQIELPREFSPEPLPARMKFVRFEARTSRLTGAARSTFAGGPYWLDRVRDEGTLQRFWIRCQVLERKRLAAAANGG